MRIKWAKMDPAVAMHRWSEPVRHLIFCVHVYKLQMKGGRYFLHVHPLTATSWQAPSIKEVMKEYGVITTRVDMCAYGMKSTDEHGTGHVYKPTQFLTDSPAIAEAWSNKCENSKAKWRHRHVQLVNGRAKRAQVYSTELCKAICRGLKTQKERDTQGRYFIGIIEKPQDVHEEYKEAVEAARLAHGDKSEDAQLQQSDGSI